ncbi:MAG: zinc-ribbon domain containing protein [Cyanobacteria bacterium HKST-UBA06]|nr:zinc-ribbon domain containing protein [Cyanobacteria bacterium HKST-UBA05]MCA9798186.1 zinc-ribbon domain containing protein [Cyanobacteria bacterium HKST-UBA04]MCA9807100.1 zinc-ribbon domain containing protein [Cyanobacteria bacterium HKST-UBA06]MCA9842308.1 zinc-ribbon domain containing protein [Cyanobacteria bacterium HKST-UBA03]
MFEEKTLQCVSCGADFPFSAEEQEFYTSKGFQEPRRCKPCRDAAKSQRRGGGGSRGPRELYDAVCAACGCQTQVPFRPDGVKPVYCRDCYQAQR